MSGCHRQEASIYRTEVGFDSDMKCRAIKSDCYTLNERTYPVKKIAGAIPTINKMFRLGEAVSSQEKRNDKQSESQRPRNEVLEIEKQP